MTIDRMIGKIVWADCLSVMKRMPDKSVDLVLTDPPYGIGAGREKPHNGWADYGISEWDLFRPERIVFKEIERISNNQIIFGGNYFCDYLPISMGWLIWDKKQRGFSLADCELIWTSYQRASRIIDYSRAAALGDIKQHPTQKALAVIKWILENYSDENDLIMDCFLGSGTTAVACVELGRRFIGIERELRYCGIARKRVDAVARQGKLFQGAV